MGTGNTIPKSFEHPWVTGVPYLSCLGCGALVEQRLALTHYANCAPCRAFAAARGESDQMMDDEIASVWGNNERVDGAK